MLVESNVTSRTLLVKFLSQKTKWLMIVLIDLSLVSYLAWNERTYKMLEVYKNVAFVCTLPVDQEHQIE
jgi:hypothetical protein